MSEYFVEITGENKRHSFRVEANFTQGRDFVSRPNNEEEFLRAADPDEVEIVSVFLEDSEGRERQLEEIPSWLEEALTEKIIEEERYGI